MAHDLSERALPPRLSRRTFLAAMAAAPLAATVACGDDGGGGGAAGGTGGNADTGTITFANWAETEDATRQGFQDLLKQFQAANADIKVETEGVAFSDIGQQLVQRVQSGNPPDIAQISGNDTFVLAATDALAPLDDLISDDVKSAINQTDIDLGTFDGKLLAFPWSTSPQGFWFNKKLMEQAGVAPEPPADIDALMIALAAIKKKFPEVTTLALDTTNRSFGLAANWAWISTFGAEPFKGSEANADTPEMQAYLAWMQELAKNGYIDPGKKIGEFRPLGAQDEVAFIWDQDVFQGVVQSTNKMSDQDFYDTWGVALPPAGPSGESGSVMLGHQLIIFNHAEAKGAAAKLIEYLATDEKAILDFTMGTNLSMPPLAEPEGAVAEAMDNPIQQAFVNEIIPKAVVPPYGPTFAQGYGPVMAGVQQAITSELPPEEITAEMQNQLEAVLG